mgnify:CR=1 FL=1
MIKILAAGILAMGLSTPQVDWKEIPTPCGSSCCRTKREAKRERG